MSVLLAHREVVFEDATVYVTGHAYLGCTFRRCTLVYNGGAGNFERCRFEGCVWHVNMVVHDAGDWDEFMANTAAAITKSLPRTAPS
jgi:hypothetical protein